ncbi:hypothetical protein ACN28S_62040 [Cystobacter fuscus]
MRLLRCALVMGWATLLVGSAASAAPERVTYALIIANNIGTEPRQAPLRYADDDGRATTNCSPHEPGRRCC